MNKKKVVVIGAGAAGMEASAFLSSMGYEVNLIEKTDKTGGHLKNWDRLFPNQRDGEEVIEYLQKGIETKVNIWFNTEVEQIDKKNNSFSLSLSNGEIISSDAILITTGYDLFNAERKEEYGYGIYNNVITSADVEFILKSKKEITTYEGNDPKRIAIVHCVGSRDEKSNNHYCSKVCCITGVKQAIELREKLPNTEIFCFYMDLRMYGPHFEELYREAQEKYGIQFIRGRLSEAAENINGSIQIKAEDTLSGRPIKMTVDLLVLLIGMEASVGTKKIGSLLQLDFGTNRFLQPLDEHSTTNHTHTPGVFIAGACSGPMSITDTLADARSAVATIVSFLEKKDTELRISYN